MEGLPLHPYDILMLAVLVLATVFGAWKGMAWQVASLASLIVSAIVAVRFSGAVAPMLSAVEPWNRFLAMLILYVLTALAIWILFQYVAGVIDRVKLKEFDRQMGALFGLAKGILLCVVITFFAVTLSEQGRQTVLRSRSGYYIARFIQRARPVLPEEIRAVLGRYIEELDRRLDPANPPTALEEPVGPDDWSRLRGAGGETRYPSGDGGSASVGLPQPPVPEASAELPAGLDRFRETAREVHHDVERFVGTAEAIHHDVSESIHGVQENVRQGNEQLRQTLDELYRGRGAEGEGVRWLFDDWPSADETAR